MTKDERKTYRKLHRKSILLMTLVGRATRRCECGACEELEGNIHNLIIDWPEPPED